MQRFISFGPLPHFFNLGYIIWGQHFDMWLGTPSVHFCYAQTMHKTDDSHDYHHGAQNIPELPHL